MRGRWLFVGVLLFACPARGWDHHEWVTTETLKKYTLPQAFVTYEPLEKALSRGLSRVQAATVDAFLKELKLNKAYQFPNKLGEQPGVKISVLSLIAKYSDEPDWGADQGLFAPGQYPELWTDDTAYVSQREGLGSQGFRHMFFPARLNWREPLSTWQIPMHPIGEAPQRAALFYDLSRDCYRRGSPYWGARFLAWSLHYVQDLHQPWHSRQLPIKSLMQFKYKWWIFPLLDVAGTAELVAYYHLSYEKWVEERMAPADSPLRRALVGAEPGPRIEKALALFVADDVVELAGSYSYRIAKAELETFPRYDHRDAIKPTARIGTEEWRAATKPGRTADLEKWTGEIFSSQGATVRRLVHDAIPQIP